ncbi:MAG: hypothetical protein HXS41_10515 [Theionarchaea archaeon]|nr:hypothetical protein [Theionarchaea archaeon]MBU7000739.1 hypothetical protein [Theionarchaea archaeon]MBU7021478.1 hypothetical protein [Theionarchaea archaeon]MBU7033581.1 hypothetical protein [Theionarchaea archaeon]MBU7039609.1 hypothetical protein [Theionarchaea archaeon]
MEAESTTEKKDPVDDGTLYLAAGGGLTAVAVAGVAASTVCPVCVVGAPLLVGYGLYKKYRHRSP